MMNNSGDCITYKGKMVNVDELSTEEVTFEFLQSHVFLKKTLYDKSAELTPVKT